MFIILTEPSNDGQFFVNVDAISHFFKHDFEDFTAVKMLSVKNGTASSLPVKETPEEIYAKILEVQK